MSTETKTTSRPVSRPQETPKAKAKPRETVRAPELKSYRISDWASI